MWTVAGPAASGLLDRQGNDLFIFSGVTLGLLGAAAAGDGDLVE